MLPNRTAPSASLPGHAFRALTPDERAHLSNWRRASLSAGIDAVEDLTSRPWPGPIADAVIGVFRFGEAVASWLVIGQDGQWVIACCTDNSVSEQFDSLAAALMRLPVQDSPD